MNPAQNPALQSPGGCDIATFPRRSRRFLESDSELEQAANLFGMDFRSPARSTQSKSPGSASDKLPAQGSLAQGSQGRGNWGRGRGSRGRGCAVKSVGATPQDEPKPGTSTGGSGLKLGQAGYVNRGRGSVGAARSSPTRGFF